MIECLEKQQQKQKQPNQFVSQVQQQSQQPIIAPQVSVISLNDVDLMHQQLNNYYQQRQTSICHLSSNQMAIVDAQPTSLQKSQQQAGNDLIGYYFGSISRETAEWILKNHSGHKDGAYLLRSSGPNDDFVLSLMIVRDIYNNQQQGANNNNNNLVTIQNSACSSFEEVLHYKIVETEDSFVALHGQVGDEKFATIDELIEKAQGVATKPRWPIQRQSLESQILPPTYWGLTIDQVRLAILIKAKQWGFPLFSSLFQQTNTIGTPTIDQSAAIQMLDSTATGIDGTGAIGASVTTLNNETIRTLVYKSLHEFQPWFHGKISRDEAERRIENGEQRDGCFLVRERDNFSYAMCISHRRTTKHYRIDVLPTGELAIQDGHKFTSLMALVSHYTIMSDGLWCALTEACPRPIQKGSINNGLPQSTSSAAGASNKLYCVPPPIIGYSQNTNRFSPMNQFQLSNSATIQANAMPPAEHGSNVKSHANESKQHNSMICPNQGAITMSIKAPIKEWLQTINQKWSQLMVAKNQQSLNSFLFGSSNPLNNHCHHNNRRGHHHHHHHHHHHDKIDNRQRGHKANSVCNHQCRSCNPKINPKRSIGLTICNQPNGGSPAANNLQANQTKANPFKLPSCSYCSATPLENCGLDSSHIIKGGCQRGCCSNDADQLATQQRTLQSTGVSTNSSRALLTCLPQNSGFTLDSQSFIGSPLFAVKNSLVTNPRGTNVKQTTDGSKSGSSTDSSNNVREEKLISPAQSISVNLNNNPYNTDIYGSLTSTALVNDCLPTNSSSSSSGNRPQALQTNTFNQYVPNKMQGAQFIKTSSCYFDKAAPMPLKNVHLQQTILPQNCQTGQGNRIDDLQLKQSVEPPVQLAGPIMCGQHAGPAYRYTNCQTDENTMKLCSHLRQFDRSADDTHLQTHNTQLLSQAAMSKFVQFQDGQCLRTHRDTRSIQMAYLLSRQNQAQQASRNSTLLKAQHTNNSQNSNQLFQDRASKQANSKLQSSRMLNNNNPGLVNGNKTNKNDKDFDLMDCENDAFEFKYDPKLIKSSSIETLCGVAEEQEECSENLSNFKTNSELLMSLQSHYGFNENLDNNNILSPILATTAINEGAPDSQAISNGNNASPAFDEISCLDTTHYGMHDMSRGIYNEDFYTMKKKHDLDELTTSLLAELTTSLKAQIDLKNKRSGLATSSVESSMPNDCSHSEKEYKQEHGNGQIVTNPSELVNEFDTLRR